MKIKEIYRKNLYIFEVTFVPNWLEKLFGHKEHTKEYKYTGATYLLGGGSVYISKDGRKLGNGNWIGEAIDRYRVSW
jgi:hypothetical protein